MPIDPRQQGQRPQPPADPRQQMDRMNPYGRAQQGETPEQHAARQRQFYTFQREQAQDRGDQGRTNQIYGKLGQQAPNVSAESGSTKLIQAVAPIVIGMLLGRVLSGGAGAAGGARAALGGGAKAGQKALGGGAGLPTRAVQNLGRAKPVGGARAALGGGAKALSGAKGDVAKRAASGAGKRLTAPVVAGNAVVGGKKKAAQKSTARAATPTPRPGTAPKRAASKPAKKKART